MKDSNTMRKLLLLLLCLLWLGRALPLAAQNCESLGPTDLGTTRYCQFTTRTTTGAPTTLAGSPVVKAYKNNNTGTEVTTGITLTADCETTGTNCLTLDLSDAFYAVDTDIVFKITTGTVGGTSVVGEVVGGTHIVLPAVSLTAQAESNLNDFFDNASTASTVTVDDIPKSKAVPAGIAFEWVLGPFRSSLGVIVTTGTPTCTRSIDSVSAYSATTNNASAVTSDGQSELSISASDMTGTYYMALKCTLTGASTYYQSFKIQP